MLFTFNTPGLEVDMFNEMDLPPEGYGRNNHNPLFLLRNPNHNHQLMRDLISLSHGTQRTSMTASGCPKDIGVKLFVIALGFTCVLSHVSNISTDFFIINPPASTQL